MNEKKKNIRQAKGKSKNLRPDGEPIAKNNNISQNDKNVKDTMAETSASDTLTPNTLAPNTSNPDTLTSDVSTPDSFESNTLKPDKPVHDTDTSVPEKSDSKVSAQGKAAVIQSAGKVTAGIKKGNGKKTSRLTDTNTPFAVATTLPSLIGVMIFFIIPFIIIIWYSFLDNPISRDFVFLKNYGTLLDNYSFKMAARNTLILSAVAVPMAVILSLGLAGLLDSKIPCKSLFRTLFLCPMMVPVASIVLIWQVMFHYHGTVNDWLGAWFEAQPVDWMKSSKCLIVVMLLFLWKNLGYNMILFLSAMNNIPKDLLEVAELEGAGAFYRLVHIKLRYLSPTILFVTILSLINSFKLFREVYLLTGDYPYEDLYLLQHFMNNTFKSLDYQKLSAAAMLMAVVMVIIIGGLFIFENKFGGDVEE